MALPYPTLHGLVDAERNFDALQRLVPMEVTALPAQPFDGQVVFFAADATNGVVWQLRYNASSSSAYKWEFVGGSSLSAIALSNVALGTTGAYTDFSDGSPTLSLPLAGDYDVEHGAQVVHSGANQGLWVSITATGLAVGNNQAIYLGQPVGTGTTSVTEFSRFRATGISGTLKMQYFVGLAGGTAERRKLIATPVRVG